MIINKLNVIVNEIQQKIKELNISKPVPKIIAVSKTFGMSEILPLIKHGHLHFGENKVQESVEKWTDIKTDFKNIKLHFLEHGAGNFLSFVQNSSINKNYDKKLIINFLKSIYLKKFTKNKKKKTKN